MSFFYDREREKSLTFLRILLNLDSMVIIIVITGSSRRGLWKRSEANVEYGRWRESKLFRYFNFETGIMKELARPFYG